MSDKFKAIVIDNKSEKFSREIKELDLSFLDQGDVLIKVDYSDLDRLIEEEYEGDDSGDTLIDVIATWDDNEVVSKFIESINRAVNRIDIDGFYDRIDEKIRRAASNKKRKIFIECLKKACLHKSINFIRASFEVVKSLSNEEFESLLHNCLRVEEGKEKVHFVYHMIEGDIYEALEYLFEKNKEKASLISDEIVKQILCLEYEKPGSCQGPLDLILTCKGKEYLQEHWINNDRLAKLIVEKRLVILGGNLIDFHTSSDVDVKKAIEHPELKDYLTRIGYKLNIPEA